jgi:hypothetical protein
MENAISISDFNYLIFIIPGFITVWTFRYFTRSEKKGEFETIAWSFIWGTFFFFVPQWIKHAFGGSYLNTPLDNIGALYGVMLGLSVFSPFLGFVGACFVNRSMFQRIKKFLFWCVEGDRELFQTKQSRRCCCRKRGR